MLDGVVWPACSRYSDAWRKSFYSTQRFCRVEDWRSPNRKGKGWTHLLVTTGNRMTCDHVWGSLAFILVKAAIQWRRPNSFCNWDIHLVLACRLIEDQTLNWTWPHSVKSSFDCLSALTFVLRKEKTLVRWMWYYQQTKTAISMTTPDIVKYFSLKSDIQYPPPS